MRVKDRGMLAGLFCRSALQEHWSVVILLPACGTMEGMVMKEGVFRGHEMYALDLRPLQGRPYVDLSHLVHT